MNRPKLAPPPSPFSLYPPLPSLQRLCNYTAPAEVHWSLASEIIKIRALSPDLQLFLPLQSRQGASETCCHRVERQPVSPLTANLSSALLRLQTSVWASTTQLADGPSLFVFCTSEEVKIYSSDFNGLSNCMWCRVNGG